MELVINMDKVKDIYNNKKLLVRAMDYPNLQKGPDGLEYDCSIWANEFCMLKNGTFSSVSTTLIVPDVGVMIYKNIGFLIDSDLADCFHISKIDSSSRGNLLDGVPSLTEYGKTCNLENSISFNVFNVFSNSSSFSPG